LVDLYIKAFKTQADEQNDIVAALNEVKLLIPSDYRQRAYSAKCYYGSLEQHSAVLATIFICTAHVMLKVDIEDEDAGLVYQYYIADTCEDTTFHFQTDYYKQVGTSEGWLDFILEYVQSQSFADHSADMCSFAVECKDCGHGYCRICFTCPCSVCECNTCECDQCLAEHSGDSFDEMSENGMDWLR
jgi:hypothetical protein